MSAPQHPAPGPLERTVDAFERRLIDNLYYSHGQALQTASLDDAYMALSYTVRDYLVDRWRSTTEAHFAANPKFVYYLLAEYLPGRQLTQNLLYSDTEELARQSLARYQVGLGKRRATLVAHLRRTARRLRRRAAAAARRLRGAGRPS